jgi:5-methylcytosine-specific restriction endonuclease McrA
VSDPNAKPRAIVLMMQAQRCQCYYCGERVYYNPKRRNGPRSATIDHIIPRANGGALGPTVNGVVACRRCNGERGTKDARIFLLEMQGMLV